MDNEVEVDQLTMCSSNEACLLRLSMAFSSCWIENFIWAIILL